VCPGCGACADFGGSRGRDGCDRRASRQPASGDPIKIGYVWGVTGAVAEIVRPASEATKAFWDDLNKKGGIKGHPVQMVEIDSKYQVPLAQEGYKKVTTDDKVPLVVLASTGIPMALAQQIGTDKVVAITLSCDEKWSMPDKKPDHLHRLHDVPGPDDYGLEVHQGQVGAVKTPRSPCLIQTSRSARHRGGRPRFSKSLGLTLVDEQKVGAADVDAQSQAAPI